MNQMAIRVVSRAASVAGERHGRLSETHPVAITMRRSSLVGIPCGGSGVYLAQDNDTSGASIYTKCATRAYIVIDCEYKCIVGIVAWLSQAKCL